MTYGILDLTTELKSQTLTLGSKIEAINTTVGAGLAKIEVVNDKINTTLDLRLTAVENKLGSNNTSLGEIKTELSNLKTAIDNVNTNITAGYTAVKGSIDDMTGQLTVKWMETRNLQPSPTLQLRQAANCGFCPTPTKVRNQKQRQ